MIIITFTDSNKERSFSSINELKHTGLNLNIDLMSKIAYIEIEGIDLEKIKKDYCDESFINFQKVKAYTIPMILGNINKMRWWGDIARTILLNL
jgi:hypothetical protein